MRRQSVEKFFNFGMVNKFAVAYRKKFVQVEGVIKMPCVKINAFVNFFAEYF